MIGIVADDMTGANDIGAMFAEAHYETHVYTTANDRALRLIGQPEVVIVDTNSRYFAPHTAYRAAADATRALRKAGCTRFFKKTCSVFRGNVGPEFDAMLDTLGAAFARRMIVVPGYPSNRRTTVHGIMYAGGKMLEHSHFRDDPVHPTLNSNIVKVLQAQTERRVRHLDIGLVRRGLETLRFAVAALGEDPAYLLFDVADEASLGIVAEATREERVFGGSAGLAAPLAPLWKPNGSPNPPPEIAPTAGLGIPVVAGSLTPVTAEQIARLERRGAARVILEADTALTNTGRDAEVDRVAALAGGILKAGRDVAIVTPTDATALASTLAEAARQGLSRGEAGRRISDALGAATARALRASGQNRLLAAGGDTSSAVCDHLEARALRIGRAVEPGLPLCTALTDPPARLVLKGGSMGSPDFIIHALEALRRS